MQVEGQVVTREIKDDTITGHLGLNLGRMFVRAQTRGHPLTVAMVHVTGSFASAASNQLQQLSTNPLAETKLHAGEGVQGGVTAVTGFLIFP